MSRVLNLYKKSIDLMEKHQADSGAFVACPNFAPYRYCWLRDGSFIAYALDLAERYERAEKFYRWVNRVIKKHNWKIETVVRKINLGQKAKLSEYLSTRYTLSGEEIGDDWANFQLDGYGTWLWGLAKHIQLSEEVKLLDDFSESINSTLLYLMKCWKVPCYDCWEEFSDQIHPSTLACIFGGLQSINTYLKDSAVERVIHEIREFVLKEAVHQDHLVKYIGSESIDASLIWLSIPFKLLEPTSFLMVNTVKKIERFLKVGEGVRRYREDSYYGGGEWIPLTAWLGWYYANLGRLEKAGKLIEWISRQANKYGHLPEQVPLNLNQPGYYSFWVKRWGEIASPLLWSHAMYVVLYKNLKYNHVLASER